MSQRIHKLTPWFMMEEQHDITNKRLIKGLMNQCCSWVRTIPKRSVNSRHGLK